MSEILRNAALTGVTTALLLTSASEAAPQEPNYHDPLEASKVLADRYTSCSIEINDKHTADATGEIVGYKLKLGVKPSAQPYLSAWKENDNVVWTGAGLVTRATLAGRNRYLPMPQMRQFGVSSEDGSHVDGNLYPRLGLYREGSFVDVWKDASATATLPEEPPRQTSRLNAIFCGRMVLKVRSGDSKLTWELDPERKQPERGLGGIPKTVDGEWSLSGYNGVRPFQTADVRISN